MSLTFRQVRGARDLEAVFRLRHRTLGTESSEAMSRQPAGLDVSPIDGMARHYAVFDATDTPVATMRAVGWTRSPEAVHVEVMLIGLGWEELRPRLPPFPLFDHLERGELELPVRDGLLRPRAVVELSRACRDPELGAASSRVFRFLAEGVLASEFFLEETTRALGVAVRSTAVLYQTYGFTAVQNRAVRLRHTKTPATLLGLDRKALLDHPIAPRLAGLAADLRANGRLLQPSEVISVERASG
jgi:hypothetical protein